MLWFDWETKKSPTEIREKLLQNRIKIKEIEQIDQNGVRIFVNSPSVNYDEIENFVKFIKFALI